MNLIESFATFLAQELGFTLNANLFIGSAPSSNKVADPVLWLVATGGAPTKHVTNDRTVEQDILLYYRDIDYKLVYDRLQEIENILNCDDCTQLTGYETINVEAATLSIDDDLDGEDRKVGQLLVKLHIHKTCEV